MSIDLSSLNVQQRQAVEHTQGPLLVLAGAGSGKTRVITYRIAHLLSLGVKASRILALSFTHKAAQEMKERLIGLLGEQAKKCHTSTFHALGVRFIKEEYQAAGLRPRFSILDEADQLEAVRQVLTQQQLDTKRYEPQSILAEISQCKSQLINPASLADSRITAMCYQGYLKRLRVMNAVDFDDLIRLPVVLMETQREVRLRWRNRFHYIMVDEYQDTNGAQLRMLKALAEGQGNLCVVGDDDQSIYGWRGAVASNILRFDQHFEGARMIALTQNYRSTNYILRAANQVIANNEERHAKTLWSAHGDGQAVRYRCLAHGEHEAEWVAQDIQQKHREGMAWHDISILYRTNQQARLFEESLRLLDIPYKVIGGSQFFDRKEIRDAYAYLRLIANPQDENALRRIINYPTRGIGDGTLEQLNQLSMTTGQSLWDLCASAQHLHVLSSQARERLDAFYQLVQPYQERIHQENWAETFMQLLEEIQMRDALHKQYKDQQQVSKRWQNILYISSSLENMQRKDPHLDLADYLHKMTLDYRSQEEEIQRSEVSLMSLHSSKGLEFHTVYLVGVEEGFMPHEKVLSEGGSLAEERRLMYVGITRAQRELTITRANKRLKRGKFFVRTPSRFLLEIPDDLFLDGGAGDGKKEAELKAQQDQKRKDAFDHMFAVLSEKSNQFKSR